MWGFVLIVVVVTFALCFGVDKGFTKLFRNKAQHRSGMAVRQNKRYGSMGFVIAVIGLAALITTDFDRVFLLVGSGVLLLVGAGLVVYYLSSGIYYDEDGFIVETVHRKRQTYRYDQIVHQQLYVLQGGGTIVELHMDNGNAVQVVSNMPGYREFLFYAFQKWCQQKGLDPQQCEFYKPEEQSWFPTKEEA